MLHCYAHFFIYYYLQVTLQGGDTLLLEANPNFFTTHRGSADFALVAPVEHSLVAPKDRFKMWAALGILLCVVTLTTAEVLPIFASALLGVAAMILCRCMTVTEAWGAVRTGVLLTIATSFCIGTALDKNGVGKAVADTITSVFEVPICVHACCVSMHVRVRMHACIVFA